MKPNTTPLQRGFSLIELMVALVIIAILVAVAVPQYQQYVQRARRAEASATLLQAASWLERVATAQGSYPLDTESNGPGLPTALQATPNGHYLLTLHSTDGGHFTLTATPQGGQTNDSCGALTLTETASQGAAGGAHCWQ
jgi:type IV pilus assembly protein PilE